MVLQQILPELLDNATHSATMDLPFLPVPSDASAYPIISILSLPPR